MVCEKVKIKLPLDGKNQSMLAKNDKDVPKSSHEYIVAWTINSSELAASTQNFRADCLLGEGWLWSSI
ncbi:hypothetical protein MA16_Dca023815 [Dendrobium catenatum]|uniref:Uncharacterized protein n=1 Tax=Dendrobium catenatum TaxID=906689 RepID=A0A2I0XFD9_9ASPA|nr:hypothetical protein MA16_Dca023815 [Dendrobium catenatum]